MKLVDSGRSNGLLYLDYCQGLHTALEEATAPLIRTFGFGVIIATVAICGHLVMLCFVAIRHMALSRNHASARMHSLRRPRRCERRECKEKSHDDGDQSAQRSQDRGTSRGHHDPMRAAVNSPTVKEDALAKHGKPEIFKVAPVVRTIDLSARISGRQPDFPHQPA
jgi:hypothetical protein